MAKVLRKIIEIDEELCNGCGKCVLACQEGALAIIDGKAKLISEVLCDGFGACLGECPTGALKIVERVAEEFDEKAVEDHCQSFSALACGCPSHQLREFTPASAEGSSSSKEGTQGESSLSIDSALTHWPVQIRLIPVSAPFLEGAKLLVCADCVPVAYPNLHLDLLPDRKIMIGCPKFDPIDEFIEKFAQLLEKRNLESIEVAIMEVPCCRGLIYTLLEARKLAKREIPIKVYVIGVKGMKIKEEVY
ncbi:MAG: ATP-binding protein [Caldimicrobium sp.]